ncbi:hypothetical protein HYX18_01115 [Candidatus Woesearchaeota archaeon]|nr:hypothetical protein [Candidatus Woesearchaeota archaeon]
MKKSEEVKIKYCPKCRTPNLDMYAASITGAYYCRKCGYIGTVVIEKSFNKPKSSSPPQHE